MPDANFYGLSQIMTFLKFSPLCFIRDWQTQSGMAYYRLWGITVWVILGLTVVTPFTSATY